MCGRFYVDDMVWTEIRKLCKGMDRTGQVPRGDVYPSQEAVILTGGQGQELVAKKALWGYESGSRSQLLINARSETVKERPMFSGDYLESRCVVPVGKFYEWKKLGRGEKMKYEFAGEEGPLYLAGICRRVQEGERFTILTTKANASMREIHDRMPVVLKKDEIKGWIFSREKADKILKEIPPRLERRRSDVQAEYEQLSLFPEELGDL